MENRKRYTKEKAYYFSSRCAAPSEFFIHFRNLMLSKIKKYIGTGM